MEVVVPRTAKYIKAFIYAATIFGISIPTAGIVISLVLLEVGILPDELSEPQWLFPVLVSTGIAVAAFLLTAKRTESAIKSAKTLFEHSWVNSRKDKLVIYFQREITGHVGVACLVFNAIGTIQAMRCITGMQKFDGTSVELPLKLYIAKTEGGAILVAPVIEVMGVHTIVIPKINENSLITDRTELTAINGEDWAKVTVNGDLSTRISAHLENATAAEIMIRPADEVLGYLKYSPKVRENMLWTVLEKVYPEENKKDLRISHGNNSDICFIFPKRIYSATPIMERIINTQHRIITANCPIKICVKLNFPLTPDKKACNTTVIRLSED